MKIYCQFSALKLAYHARVFFTVYTCRSKRTSCACSSTVGAYGGREGTAFVDVPTNHCGVDITEIWVYSGDIMDSIQVKYRFSDGHSEIMPRRGGSGGGLTHITIPQAGKVIGLTGVTTFYTYGTVITQLRVVVLNSNNNVQIYGPFGTEIYTQPSVFAVYGDIKSIFGYHGDFLNGLGVYYESWGTCTTPCV